MIKTETISGFLVKNNCEIILFGKRWKKSSDRMYIGRYYHRLENNGRLSLPKAFRHRSSSWIVTRGLDGGLFLFEPDTFSARIGELNERTLTQKKNRDFTRLMVNDAVTVTPDSLGRVLLPEYLISLAELQKEVVIVGSYSFIEIWQREKYHHYLNSIAAHAEEIAESIEHQEQA